MYGQAAIKEPFVLAGGKQGIFCTGDGPTTSQDKRGYTFHTSPAPGADGTGQDGGNNPHQGSAGATLQPKERWLFPHLPFPSFAAPMSELHSLVWREAHLPFSTGLSLQKIITNTCDPPARSPDKGFSSSCLSTQLLFHIFWNALFIFALVCSSEIRLILQGVIFGLGKIRNQCGWLFPQHRQQTSAFSQTHYSTGSEAASSRAQ